jgi:hypothetical protein
LFVPAGATQNIASGSLRPQGTAQDWTHGPGVVFIRMSPMFPGTSAGSAGWTSLLGFAAIVIGMAIDHTTSWIAGITIVCVACIIWIASRVSGGSNAARGREILGRVADDSWEHRTERAIVQASMHRGFVLGSDPRVGVDAGTWFGPAPQAEGDAPRPSVILCNIRPEVEDGGEKLDEEVEVGPSRRLKPQDRKRRIWGLAALVVVMMFLWYATRATGIPTYLWLLFFGVQAGVIVYRLGWGPIQINAAIASIGKLEVVHWGIRRSYSTRDSVLVVTTIPGTSISGATRGTYPVIVHAVHRDGYRSTLLFDTMQDPGLSDLLRRWTHADAPQIVAPGTEQEP